MSRRGFVQSGLIQLDTKSLQKMPPNPRSAERHTDTSGRSARGLISKESNHLRQQHVINDSFSGVRILPGITQRNIPSSVWKSLMKFTSQARLCCCMNPCLDQSSSSPSMYSIARNGWGCLARDVDIVSQSCGALPELSTHILLGQPRTHYHPRSRAKKKQGIRDYSPQMQLGGQKVIGAESFLQLYK